MKVTSFLVFLCTCLTSLGASDPTAYRWKNRLLIVLAASDDNPSFQEQKSVAARNLSGFKERDLIVLAESDKSGPLHARFSKGEGEFRVLLIGKDGHVALEESKPVDPERLFALIDSMPMRRDEMRRSGERKEFRFQNLQRKESRIQNTESRI